MYWGVIRNKRIYPSTFFDRKDDARYSCGRLNRIYEQDGKKPYYIKRFMLEIKGEQVDTYEHSTQRIVKNDKGKSKTPSKRVQKSPHKVLNR